MLAPSLDLSCFSYQQVPGFPSIPQDTLPRGTFLQYPRLHGHRGRANPRSNENSVRCGQHIRKSARRWYDQAEFVIAGQIGS
jgi:hypothetical protein